MNAPINSAAGPVLLFDGECGLCHRVVRLLLRLDADARLRFAALQSGPAQEFLRAHRLPAEDFDTLVLVPDWPERGEAPVDFLLRTDGAIAALRSCGGAGRLMGDVLALFPTMLRDAGYRCVARVRYRIFGPWQAGPLPRSDWAARFLT